MWAAVLVRWEPVQAKAVCRDWALVRRDRAVLPAATPGCGRGGGMVGSEAGRPGGIAFRKAINGKFTNEHRLFDRFNLRHNSHLSNRESPAL
jgi:hypothetical protein